MKLSMLSKLKESDISHFASNQYKNNEFAIYLFFVYLICKQLIIYVFFYISRYICHLY